MPVENFTFQSVNLNPENKHKSHGEKKILSKQKSKIKRRELNTIYNGSHAGSVDKKQSFFPTLDLNEAYNPSV